MNTNKKNKEFIISALLIAISMVIVFQFGFLKVVIPPAFSATIASHVPGDIAMMISPLSAFLVGLGSAISFFLAGTPLVIVARATSHIVYCTLGAYLLRYKKMGYVEVILITGVVHAIYEAIIIIPFIGFAASNINMILITAAGTFIHHLVDGAIAFVIAGALKSALKVDLANQLRRKKI